MDGGVQQATPTAFRGQLFLERFRDCAGAARFKVKESLVDSPRVEFVVVRKGERRPYSGRSTAYLAACERMNEGTIRLYERIGCRLVATSDFPTSWNRI